MARRRRVELPRRERRGSGELEAEVLAALWAAPHAMTPGEVQSAMGDTHLAYNTVLTILTRLHDKGLAERERSGRAHAYRPTTGQAEFTAARMHALLDRGADHAAVLQRFLTGLSPDDERALRALLDH